MDIYVLDEAFNRIEVIDEFESCIWNIKCFEVGDFELYLPFDCKNIEILRAGRYVVRDKDIIDECMYNVMCIEKVQTQTDVENGDNLIVTGRCLKSITGRRVIWSQTILNDTVENAIYRLLDENIISPKVITRKIENVILGDKKGFTETIKQQVTGDNLQEYIVKTLTSYGIGWECCVNENKQIVFNLFKGVNRSLTQDDHPHVVFSPDNENILNSDYSVDWTNYKNVALVAGEGEGTTRKRAVVGEASGIDRYEIYVDSRDTSTNDGEITEAEYTELLTLDGTEALSEHKKIEIFEGDIEPYDMYVYGTDYHLGDIVTVINTYEVTANPRIIGVIESYSNNEGESIIPTFSTWTE